MKDQKFEVTFHVGSKMLPTLLAVVAPECELKSVKPFTQPVTHHVGIPRQRAFAPKQNRYTEGVKGKGVTGRELALRLLREALAPLTKEIIEREFVKHKFAATTANPILNLLRREGLITRNEADGRWKMVRQGPAAP